MKKLLFLFCMFAAPFMAAQVTNYNLPDCIRPFNFNVASSVIAPIIDRTVSQPAGRGIAVDNRVLSYGAAGGCTTWHFVYWISPTISAVSVETDFALDNFSQPGTWTVWPAAQVNGTLPLTGTSGVTKSVSFFGFPDWISVFLNSATGSGTVSGILYGWRAQGVSDTVSGATPVKPNPTTPADATSNTSVQGFQSFNLGFNGTTWDRMRVSPSGDGQATTGIIQNAGMLFNGATWDRWRSAGLTGAASVVVSPSGVSVDGITPVVSTAVESSHILKASAGNFYGACVTTGATAGFMMVFNATSAPADGAVTPTEWIQIAANSTACLSYGSGPPNAYATGITLVYSSTGPFTKTASATAAFVGRVK